jgi:hypothetical protein
MYIQQHHKDGPLFITHTVAATTAYKDIYPKLFALESQGPEQLATSFWQDFDKAGCKVRAADDGDRRRARHGSPVACAAGRIRGACPAHFLTAGCDRQTTRALAVITTVR